MLDPALVHQMAQMFLARPANHRSVPVHQVSRAIPDFAAVEISAGGQQSRTTEAPVRAGGVSPAAKSTKQLPAGMEVTLPGKQSRKRVQRVVVAEPK
jgi:hypothetical protein